MPGALSEADDVKAVVHAVNQENVCMPGGTEQSAGAWCATKPSMAGLIARPSVGLGLNDSGHTSIAIFSRVREAGADHVPGYLNGVTLEKREW